MPIMTIGLRAELKQRKPFATTEEVAFLNTLRTADHLLRGEVEVLRGADLTFPQYNVLRILRGAGPQGLSCGDISDRMVTRDSDITRLLDRLEARDLVARGRDERDRRVVVQHISPKGLALLKELDEPVQRVHQRHLRHMTRAQLRQLTELLELARAGGLD
jgi:DNA-binding MarR family transcriptional regulator